VVEVSQAHAQNGLISANVRIAADIGDPADRVRDVAAALDPLAQVTSPDDGGQSQTLINLGHALVAGAFAVLLMIGASLLVAAVEQLRERRRVLAVLSAFGTRRSTIAWSVLWQTGIPIICGLALAMVLGTALGTVLMNVFSLPLSYDWKAVALMTGAGAGVIAAVTIITLPILWRLMTPNALQVE
jgi:predicted lysophospholipase L1 biosynthesis ABC-type transport system permease subunit